MNPLSCFLLLLMAVLISENHAAKQEEWMKCFSDPDYEELLDIARNGLGGTSKPQTVVIVGAGISGLTAAKLLVDAGHKADENAWYFFRNERKRVSEVQANANLFGYELAPSERGKSPEQLFEETLDKATKNCTLLKEKYDSFSIQGYLIQEGNLSTEAVHMIGDLMIEDGGFYASFLHSVNRHVTFSDAGGFEEITGGFDQLPNNFLREMPRTVCFNCTVERIVWLSNKVKIYYRKSGKKILPPLTADYVLVTATAKATQLITFQPPLSHVKAHALRSYHYASSTKIALACTERFWEKDGIRAGRSVTDHPSRVIYYPNHDFPSGIGVLLASYTTRDDADFFDPLSDEKCIDVVMDDLSAIHQVSKDYLRSICKKHVIKKWSLDPISMGAVAFPTPFQYKHFFKALSQNEGRILFAGERIATPHAWIDTAMKSAIRAASRIHNSYLIQTDTQSEKRLKKQHQTIPRKA